MPYQPEYQDLIIRYLNDPQNEKLHDAVTSFRSKSIDQENYFLEMEKLWLLSSKSAALVGTNKEKSANALKSILTQSSKSNRSYWYWIGRIAAIITIISVGVLVYNLKSDEVFLVKETLANQIDSVALPDGSKVILAENSVLKYAEKFNTNDRNVHLIKGEAFFKIAKDPKHPFKVIIDQSDVAVLGTSFNIKIANNKIDLGVITGKVLFRPYQNGATSILVAGQALTYDVLKKEFLTKTSQNANAWLTKELIFVDTPLEEVCKQLSNYFDADIKLKNNKRVVKKLNATFKAQSLDQVLEILKETYNIKISKENNQINLTTH
jgi:transmembrane sensor